MPDGPYGYKGPRLAPALFDPAASAIKYYPLTKYVSDTWKQGKLPFWNPYAGGGAPLLANAENFVLAPLRIPLYASPTPGIWNAWWLARLWLAGGLAFLLALRLGLAFVPALLAGTAYMLSGYLILSLNLFHLDVDALLPGLLLALDLLLVSPSRKAFLATAGTWWIMCLGGSPQALAVDFVLAVAWIVVRLSSLPKKSRTPAIKRIALAFGAGIAGALVQWLPMFELMSRSHHLHSAGSGRSGVASIPADSALSLLGPWASMKDAIPFYYAGLSVLLLAILGAISSWRGKFRDRRMFILLGAVALFEGAKIFGFPGISIIGILPVFRLVWWVKYCGPMFLGLAILAGVGVTAFSQRARWPARSTRQTRSGLKHTGIELLVLLLVWGELAYLRPGPHPAPHDPLTPAPYVEWLQKEQAMAPDKCICGVGVAFMPMTATAFRLKDVRMEDTLIDKDQYKTLYDGFSAPKEPRYSMFMTLDGLDHRKLSSLRKFGVRWLVAEPKWRPSASEAGSLSLVYKKEMNVWLVDNSGVFHGFPPRGKTAFLLGLWISMWITPALLLWGLARLRHEGQRAR